MSESNPLFVVVQFGEVQSWAYSEKAAMDSAHECVDQQITDHWRHKLPIQVTPELARNLDVRVYRCDAASQVELPIQQWFDENYRQRQEAVQEDAERDYKRFLELRAQYEERFQRENSRPSSALPNCS